MSIRHSFRSLFVCVVAVAAMPVAAAAQFSANAYYHIKPRHALQAGYNKCLDVENVSALDNAKIQQYTCNTAWPQDNQLWTLVPTGSGTYRIASAVGGKCLDVLNPGGGNGALYQQYACNLQWSQGGQLFNVTPSLVSGYYRISSVASSGTQCLDVPWSSLADGQDLQQWTCGPWWQDNQDWQIVATPWGRRPVGHVQYFGWYGEGNLYNPASNADDHANMIVYTAQSLPQVASRPAHVKAKLALVDMIVLKPKNADLWANAPDGSDGGLRSDICQHWSLTRASVAPHMARVAAFYLDEPIWNLRLLGWSDADAQTIVQTVAQVVKGGACPGGPADPTIPFAVVEAWPTANVALPSAVDWVGFDCYGDPSDCNGPGAPVTPYLSLWNTQKSLLLPHQKRSSVPPATIDRTPIQAPCDIQTAINSVTPTEANTKAAWAHYYLTIAMAEPKVVAVWPWHGPSRYFQDRTHRAIPCRRVNAAASSSAVMTSPPSRVTGSSSRAPSGSGSSVRGQARRRRRACRDGDNLCLDVENVSSHWQFLARSIGFRTVAFAR